MAVIHVKSNTVADFTGTVTVGNSAGGTQTIAATDLVRPSDWNSAHSQVYTLGGNTAGQSTVGGADLQFHGAGNITVVGSTGSLVISGPAWSTYDHTQFGHVGPAAQTSFSLTQNSIFIFSHLMERYCAGAAVRIPVQIADQSTALSSGQRGMTIDWAIYTRHSTNSTLLTQHYSTNWTIAASHSSNVSFGYSLITGLGNSTSYNTTAISSAGLIISGSVHGGHELLVAFSSTLAPGEYWIAQRWSSSGAGSTQGVLHSFLQIVASINTFARLGAAANSSNMGWQKYAGCGVYSVTSAAMPAAINMTQINNAGIYPVCYWAALTE